MTPDVVFGVVAYVIIGVLTAHHLSNEYDPDDLVGLYFLGWPIVWIFGFCMIIITCVVVAIALFVSWAKGE